MWICALITVLFGVYFCLRARHCHKRSLVRDGNIEGLGLFLYVPLAAFSFSLAIVFSIIALIHWLI